MSVLLTFHKLCQKWHRFGQVRVVHVAYFLAERIQYVQGGQSDLFV